MSGYTITSESPYVVTSGNSQAIGESDQIQVTPVPTVTLTGDNARLVNER